MDQEIIDEPQSVTLSKQSPGILAIGRKFNESDALKCFARLAVSFGDQRVTDPRTREILATEWVGAFDGYHPNTVQIALTEIIRKSKFWPTISEVMEVVRADMPRPSLPRFKSEHTPDLTPDEIKRRIEIVAAAKRQYAYEPKTDFFIKPIEAAPASQEMTVSAELMRSCAVRRAKGLPTCRNDCAYQNCELRTNEELQC